MEGSLAGKVAAVFGIANQRSIAFGIAQNLAACGARLALSYQNERMGKSIDKLAEDLGNPWRRECDVTQDSAVAEFFGAVRDDFGRCDIVVHSVATAKREELGGSFLDTSWEGFALAQEVSAFSLVRLCKHAAPMLEEANGSVLALTYLGSERVVPNYNVMGVAKASLESCVRYLASDLGPRGVRVNAISAGPIRTLSASGVSDLVTMLNFVAEKSPMRRNVTIDEVGKAARFLLSDEASGVTGQILFVDSGYHIMGM
ncbi:MAG: enoyl-ACP reductase [Planctomycetes bacterium]|nr:enoyl-ACP reductase [Planctomycetota bacterium]MCB9919573.1 enoyl-ACP reductase [Planctomycetota bacterium]